MDIEILNTEAPEIADVLITTADCSGDNGGAEVILENASLNTKIEWRKRMVLTMNRTNPFD